MGIRGNMIELGLNSKRRREFVSNNINGEKSNISLSIDNGVCDINFAGEIFRLPQKINTGLFLRLLSISNKFTDRWTQEKLSKDSFSATSLSDFDCNKLVFLLLGILSIDDIKKTRSTIKAAFFREDSEDISESNLEQNIREISLIDSLAIVGIERRHLFLAIKSPSGNIFRLEKLGPQGPINFVPLKHDWYNLTNSYGHQFSVTSVDNLLAQKEQIVKFYYDLIEVN